jgi:hypothetical protein
VGQRLQGTHEEIEAGMAFDQELLSYHQTAEWGNRGLQGSFGWLRVPLEINHVECRGDLLETCVRSFNLCARRVGMNQIRNVYMPLWQHDTNEEVWHNFKSMLFLDQRKNDQVA